LLRVKICTSGTIAAGSSSVPAQTSTVSPGAAWYLFHSAVPHFGQRNTSWGLPLLPGGTENAAGSAPLASMNLRSIHMLRTKAVPLSFWQSRQWQAWTIIGALVSR
jgi:hypothetical protein